MQSTMPFSIGAAFSYGYTALKNNFGFFILLSFIFSVIALVKLIPWNQLPALSQCTDFSCMCEIIKQPQPISIIKILASFISVLTSIAIAFLLIKFSLSIYQQKTISFRSLSALFSKTFLRFLGTTILIGIFPRIGTFILTILGIILATLMEIGKLGAGIIVFLLILPWLGIILYLAIRICLVGNYLVDNNSAWLAIVKSFASTKGHMGKIALISMTFFGLAFLEAVVGTICILTFWLLLHSIIPVLFGLIIVFSLMSLTAIWWVNVMTYVYYHLLEKENLI